METDLPNMDCSVRKRDCWKRRLKPLRWPILALWESRLDLLGYTRGLLVSMLMSKESRMDS